MPKVDRKQDAKEAALPLREVPVGMEIEGLPAKPTFSALAAADGEKKLEFRRVSERVRRRLSRTDTTVKATLGGMAQPPRHCSRYAGLQGHLLVDGSRPKYSVHLHEALA